MHDMEREKNDEGIGETGRGSKLAMGPIGLVVAGVVALGGKALKPLLGGVDEVVRPALNLVDDAAGATGRHADDLGHVFGGADDLGRAAAVADDAERGLGIGLDDIADGVAEGIVEEVAVRGLESAIDAVDEIEEFADDDGDFDGR